MYTDTPESKTRKVENIAAELELSPAEAEMVYQDLRSAINLKSAINTYSTKPATRGFFEKYPWLESVAWKTCGEDALTVRLNGFTWGELDGSPETLVNWFPKSGAAWVEVLSVIAELDRPMWRESQPDLTFTAWRNGSLEIATGGVRW